MALQLLVLTITMFTLLVETCHGGLRVGFYEETCPDSESIVTSIVRDATLSNPNLAPVLLRLHFHDCFVEGCDGSILVDNGASSERHAFGHQGVGGFEVIERAKQRLENVCPGVVSCADIVALAARDAIAMANGPAYQVPTGRRDGRVSNLSLADDMPDVGDSVQVLKNKFLQKGLSDRDLVLLSAAHTIGTTACFFMTKRLYNFSPDGGSDPAIDPNFLLELKTKCPENGDVNARLAIDRGGETSFDNQILQNIRNGFAVLESDARLNDDVSTSIIINSYFGLLSPLFGPFFENDFVEAIVRMGQIGAKTGFDGEIRSVCSAFN